jgi:hypothetical protein
MLAQPPVKQLLSSEHFSVDGTLVEAWASLKSFKPKEPGTPPSDRPRWSPLQLLLRLKRVRQLASRHLDRDRQLGHCWPGMTAVTR